MKRLILAAAAALSPGAPPAHAEPLAQGPVQPVALAGDEAFVDGYSGFGEDRRYVLRAHRGGTSRVVFSAPAPVRADPDGGTARRVSATASATHIAVLTESEAVSGFTGSSAYDLEFGRRGGARREVLRCETTEEGLEPPAHRIDGGRLVVLDDRCSGMAQRLLVADGDAPPREIALPFVADVGRLEVAGDFAAVAEAGQVRVLRISDTTTVLRLGERATAFAVQADGRVAAAVPAGEEGCPRIFTASPSAPQPTEIPGARTCGRIRLSGDRVTWPQDGRLRTARIGAAPVDVSGGVPSSTTFHADADRALVGFEGCAYFEVHVVGLDGTGAPRLRRDCPIRRHRVARVRGRDALVRVACRHGCVLSVLGSAEAHALPGRTATLRVRLSDRRRRRLRATGAVDLSLLVHVRRPLREERVQRIRVSVRR